MTHLEISLLGTVQVRRDEQPVSDRAYAKVLALLAYLAVESDRPHQRVYLATLLWPDQSDERARHSLRQALSTLRRTIGDDAGDAPHILVSRDAIAFNRTSDYRLDVEAFRRLLDACDRHEHARLETCAPCAQRMQQAVALYRGEFLQGFSVGDTIEFEDWVQAIRERLRQRALEAVSAIATWHEERGALDDACDSLRRLLELDPWQEAAHRRLIRMLMESGKRTEALAQYERCRQMLEEELGLEPEPETVELYEQLRSSEGTGASIASRSTRSWGGARLPVPPTALVGRERELEEIADLLAHRDCRLLTLIGPGGSGKTRLAIQVATDHERQFPGSACFVSLATVTDAVGIVPAIAGELGITLIGNKDPERQLLDWVRDRSLFLVLDNVEHLVGDLRIVSRMLSSSPGLIVLSTSRERLNLHDEWVFEVGGLSVPIGSDTDSFEGYGAVELLRERLRQVRTRQPLQREERPAVVRICQMVEGMPLALELAAAWAQSLTLDQIVTEIRKNLDFLSTSMRDVPDRHRSIRAVFNQSWSMLGAEEQSAYRRLSVFQGGFLLDAAEEVAGTSSFQLAALVGKSLLAQQPSGRYRLHELLRQYGDERLRQDPDEYHALRERHCECYLGLLSRHEEALTGRDQMVALDVIERDIDNIREAWRWAIDHHHAELICAASHPLWLFYVIRGMMREGADVFGRVTEAIQAMPADGDADRARDLTLARAKALTRSGGFRSGLGRYDEAIQHIEEGIRLLRVLDERRELGLALNMLAAVHHMKGDFRTSRVLLEESLEHFRHVHDAWGVAFSLNDLGLVSYLLEENLEAERFCEESRSMFRAIGDRRGTAFADYNLAMIAERRGDFARAKALYEESLSMREFSHDRWGIAASMVQLGAVMQQLGDTAAARDMLVKALGIAWDSSVTPVVLDALVELAALDLEAGETEKATELLAAIADHPATTGQLQGRIAEVMRSADVRPREPILIDGRDRWAVRAVDDFARELVG